jgi:hypothetical protein
VQFLVGEIDFSFDHDVQTGSGPHPAPYTVGTECCFPGVMWPWHEADHLPPSSAEVEAGGAIPSLPHTSPWCGV